MPIDGHGVLGLCAPRACAVATAHNDHASDMVFADEMNLKEASTVYSLLGKAHKLRNIYRYGGHHGYDDVTTYFDWFDRAFGRVTGYGAALAAEGLLTGDSLLSFPMTWLTPAGFDWDLWNTSTVGAWDRTPPAPTAPLRERISWLLALEYNGVGNDAGGTTNGMRSSGRRGHHRVGGGAVDTNLVNRHVTHTGGSSVPAAALLPGSTGGSGLRCNTYIGTDVATGGAGIESCLPGIKNCAMRKFAVGGVRTYTMSCDDFLQCAVLPPNTCCTKPHGVVVRCSRSNFNASRVNASSFGPDCSANCSMFDSGHTSHTSHTSHATSGTVTGELSARSIGASYGEESEATGGYIQDLFGHSPDGTGLGFTSFSFGDYLSATAFYSQSSSPAFPASSNAAAGNATDIADTAGDDADDESATAAAATPSLHQPPSSPTFSVSPKAAFAPTSHPAIIWLHPYSYNTGYTPTYGQDHVHVALASAGFVVMAFDQIGMGLRNSDGGNRFYARHGGSASLLGQMVKDTRALVGGRGRERERQRQTEPDRAGQRQAKPDRARQSE